jgi:hypothetical protein
LVSSIPIPCTTLHEAPYPVSNLAGPSTSLHQRASISDHQLLHLDGISPRNDSAEETLLTSRDLHPLEGAAIIDVQESKEGLQRALDNHTLSVGFISPLEAGAREPEEIESTLNSLIDTLIPSIKINKQVIKLPTYIGRTCINHGESSGFTNSTITPASQGSDFTWSRGLGAKISPI